MPPGTATVPLHERLLIRRIEEGERIDEETLFPQTAKRRPWKGEVLAVGGDEGPGAGTGGAPDVKVGDRVLFGRHSGIEVTIRGEDLLILPEHAFLVVLT
jgi:chaperonin GroES